ncbi:hypothetical protein OQJ18_14245 [Fluoribacter dumoffii]|uniref:Uncharacterized protein n=1 Tax=Fluoribacter dumoffii TaxID=463 RepID=A0A377GDD0_9GAMM|nr:hypothetical protein [Fluoribacter dumoffii]KTC91131.1 hypothetical protein Ldum_2199 [Fluoribacter dumoffii NY 23]MCW8416740.1 hypothetical protein [Fluoribacter dumoffii]MCW8455420.1 hypothetical protein [Fluoribacter dumoffii]MCW8460502.1 hypothetical protein [Fluoribacter dumoffii]MCW8483983.1 hypothetical protein [Fluoribacter dumoffii]
MKFFNHPQPSYPMISANLGKKGVHRLVTVIHNNPWYRSTGRNSGYPGTWFFFGGILEKKNERHAAGWFIKPKALVARRYSKTQFFGYETAHYVRKHSLHKLISFARFGDIKKICISASLGEGFWLSEQGKKLKKYLLINYPKYFLPDDVVKKINKTAKRPDLPVYTKRKQVNRWLSDQGVACVGLLHDDSLLFKP